MKRVEYVCDVCGGELLPKHYIGWYEMKMGRGLFNISTLGNQRLDVCSPCWENCKKWANNNKWNKGE